MQEDRFFLNVHSSLSGKAWQSRLDQQGEARAQQIAQMGACNLALARILAGRNVTIDMLEHYLAPTLRDLMPDPLTMQDMGRANSRLMQAIQNREPVAIFGDYDVDGACAAALLSEYLTSFGCQTHIHIPDRIREGYGPNDEAIRSFDERGVKLVVSVDCGVTSFEPFALAQHLGLETIVFDHHQAPEILPKALAIVDPNRQDDLSGLGSLCATGVVFMALVDLNRRLRTHLCVPDLIQKLDLVALATVADVVPLKGLNRAFVVRGLEIMRKRARPGLTALLDIAGADGPPTAYHLGFLVGPRINAGGRIGDAGLGARCLNAESVEEAHRIATELNRLNRERQRLEAHAVAEAEVQALVSLEHNEQDPLVCVASEHWPAGLIGLIAARLKERFQRPAFVFTLAGDKATGSARSIPGMDVGKCVHDLVMSGLADRGGGHAMAAGLTISRAQLENVRAALASMLSLSTDKARTMSALCIDSALTAGAATSAFLRSIEAAGPFGAGNPEPVFAFPHHRLENIMRVGEDHLRFRILSDDGKALEAIAFRIANRPLGQALRTLEGGYGHFAGTLMLDRYGKQDRVRMRLLDAAALLG